MKPYGYIWTIDGELWVKASDHQPVIDKSAAICPECKAEVLYECVACSSNNYPPQRTWVGLTDEEMLECNIDGDYMVDREIAKLNVQAKLKEKNT